jgi:membrane fusion protein (multidrug efflux system)
MNDEAKKTDPGEKPDINAEEDAISQVPLFRKKRVLIPFLLFIMAIFAGAWYWFVELRNFVSTDDAFVDADRVSISAKVLGRISRLTVDEGSAVKKGDILVQLDDSDLRAQLEQAKANLTLARESLPLSRVNLARSQDDFQRADVQFKKAIVTQEQHSHAQKTLEAARAELAIAVARVGVAEAQLGVVETQMQNMVMTAPFDGIVAKRWLLAGDVEQPGQPILAIYDLGKIWITANLEETKLAKLKLGDRVEVNVDTYPGVAFWGNLVWIGNYTASEFSLIPPNNASGNFTKITQRVPLKIFLDEGKNPRERAKYPLRPGMSAEIKIKVQ